MDIQEEGDQIDLAHITDRRQALVNAVMNIQVP